jgi:clostripain
MKWLSILTILLLVFGLTGCRKPASPEVAQWTLMFYLDADNDLEEPALNDLREMLSVGSSDDVQMVVLCDRSDLDSSESGYSNERVFNVDDWDSGLLLHVGHEELEVLDDLGEINMAASETLSQFIQQAAARYPAKKYALFIGDHGMGWEGVCSDDSVEDDALTLNEIRQALQDSKLTFELIGFDACFMGGIEVAFTVAPHGKVLVASEELEPVLGWDYASLTRRLQEQPDTDVATLARLLLADYTKSFAHSDNADTSAEAPEITLSAIDLSKLPEVETRFEEFAGVLLGELKNGDRDYWLALAKSRLASEEYGADDEEGGVEAFDLLGFVQQVSKNTQHPDTKKAAELLESAISDSIIFNVAGTGRPGSQGLSVYLPVTGDSLRDYKELSIWTGRAWPLFLDEFLKQSARETPTLLSDLELSGEVALPHRPVDVTATLEHINEVSELYFVLVERHGRELTVLGRERIEPQVHLERSWNGNWLTTEDNIIFPISNSSLRLVPMETAGGKEISLQVLSNKVLGAYVGGTSGIRQVPLEAGDILHPVYPVMKDFKEHEHSVRDDLEIVVGSEGQIELSEGEVETGDYEIGFLALDHAGQWNLELAPVRFGLEE